MRKLSDIRGEDALDVLADIFEPAIEIFGDKDVAAYERAGLRAKAISAAIKNHKKAVIQILAILDGEDPKTYSPSLMALPMKLMEILNDPDIVKLFSSQSQTPDGTPSGSATASTEEVERI